MSYDPQSIDLAAKKVWKDQNVYTVENDFSKPKCYVLDMFPYPSGAGLHVGHPLGYVASDIYARYKRMKGYNVLHPMGFDSFGLPAEQYAIETGRMPQDTTRENIEVYKAQLDKIGLSFDWSRQVVTSDPSYYKWTQWIFLEMYGSYYHISNQRAESISDLIADFEKNGNQSGLGYSNTIDRTFDAAQWASFSEKEKSDILMHYRLAYISYGEVNWCEALGTVLANDEVVNGRSERGGHPVIKKKMRQWSLRITAYAERLLRNLDGLDFSESLKDQQRNWIGKSKGASINFAIQNSNQTIEVFTTRADTIYGVSFMVLAPEHPLIEHITSSEYQTHIKNYQEYCLSRSDIDRQANKEASGQFTGSYCVHPLTQKPIPIYIAEYVLMGYGTGAIMAVPAEDERDRKFAEKYGLDILPIYDKSEVEHPDVGDKKGKLVHSEFINGMSWEQGFDAVMERLAAMGLGQYTTLYRLRDANFSRQRYWGEPFPILWNEDIPYPMSKDSLPLENAEIDIIKPTTDGQAPQARNPSWVNAENGYRREVDTMPGFAGSSWYFLRYMDPHNPTELVDKKLATYWNQVDLYVGGTEHAVGHLLYSRFYTMFLYDRGVISFEEPYKRLVNQGMIQGRSSFVYRSVSNPHLFISKNKIQDEKEVIPIHVDIRFVENDILDIAKFKQWRKEYQDAEFDLEDGQYICGWEIEKMSKSKYNVVNPDDVIEKYGADTLRMYEMFLGPIEQSKPWNQSGIEGVSKFLRRFWNLYFDENSTSKLTHDIATKEELKILHKTIEKIEEDMERMSFNTSVSSFMIALNELTKLSCHTSKILLPLLRTICPLAPHTAEAIWQRLGHNTSIVLEPFPILETSYLIEDSIEYPISINGKTRAKIQLPTNMDEDAARQSVMSDESVLKWLEGKEIKRFIFVKSRMINIVV